MLLNKILLISVTKYIITQYISDDTVLQDLSAFLGLKDSYATVGNAINNSNAPFTCNQAPIPASPTLKYDVDTGSQDCGWEIAAITIACTNSRLSGLQFQLRNVVKTDLTKSTASLGAVTTKTYNIPKDVYITKAVTGTAISLNRDFIVSLVFELSNGQSAKMTCYNPRVVNTITYTPFERVNGFYGTMYYGSFTSIGFYKHSIASRKSKEDNGTSVDTYYSLMRSDKTSTYNDVADNFIKIGPFGQKQGKFFEDPYLYGHWNITKILLAAGKSTLISLQTNVVNSFFYYLQVTEIHGDSCDNSSQAMEINVPDKSCISSAEFVTDRNNNLIGIAFYFSNNTSTGYIGQAPNKISGYTSVKYDVKDNQEIVGFFGYENEISILGLGLLVVEKNNPRFYRR